MAQSPLALNRSFDDNVLVCQTQSHWRHLNGANEKLSLGVIGVNSFTKLYHTQYYCHFRQLYNYSKTQS